jgi:uncharacterized damage-inducible protein DinB
MTLEEAKQLFAYNSWATNRIFDALAALPVEQYRKNLKGSHQGIHGTLTHLVTAEKIWLSRWVGNPDTAHLKPEEVTSLADLKAIWETVARETVRFLSTMKEKKMQDSITITSARGDKYTHTYAQTFQHLVNHSSYHRGQIVTMLRQLGGQPVSTDLIGFYRQTRGVDTQK